MHKNKRKNISVIWAQLYIQLFDLPTGTEVFCNRGTAGIDGSTATAMGAAQINPKKTVLITGDLSFFYDVKFIRIVLSFSFIEYWKNQYHLKNVLF